MSAHTERHRRDLLSAVRNKLPKKPGVYLFSDQNGDIMYVGKSVNLRQRISSYFSADLNKIEYRVREMVLGIGDIGFYETGTELLALLLEDLLIKTYQPRYNVRQQQYLGYQYILLTGGTYPTCKMISHVDDPGQGRLFGPFKNKFFVKDLLWVIRRCIKLRSCEDPEPLRYSLGYEFGYCTGPCREKISPEEYGHIVRRVIEFLEGEKEYVAGKMAEAMEEASAALQFEKAEELKERIEFCERFCERQRFLHRFQERILTIHENGSSETVYTFENGQLKSLHGASPVARNCEALLQQEMMSAEVDPRFLLDRGNIVYSWIHNEKNECEYFFTNSQE